MFMTFFLFKAPEIISESFMPDVIAKAQVGRNIFFFLFACLFVRLFVFFFYCCYGKDLLGSPSFELPPPPDREALPLQKKVEEAHGAGLVFFQN